VRREPRRLGVDGIDLYQVNAPDPAVPIEETLEALDRLVRAGKVRALGCSNFPAYLLAWAVAIQDREGVAPFIGLQAQYSLVERSLQLELLPFCRAAGLAVPGVDENRSGGFERGGWAREPFDDEAMAFVDEIYDRADAFLFGRRPYDLFAGYWGAMNNPDSPITGALNTTPKYVAFENADRPATGRHDRLVR
jgi:aryl-alcohol dehydrogenase-like predicted oxidoreductase